MINHGENHQMNKDITQPVLNKLFWFKDQVDDQEDYLMALLHLSVELGDEDTEMSIRNILEINGKI